MATTILCNNNNGLGLLHPAMPDIMFESDANESFYWEQRDAKFTTVDEDMDAGQYQEDSASSIHGHYPDTAVHVNSTPDSKSYTILERILDDMIIPEFSTKSIIEDHDMSDDDALESWKRTHPDLWTNDDVLNLIYYIAGEGNGIKSTHLRGENFQRIRGADLCSMTEEDFVQRDPQYGPTLYRCIRDLMQQCQFLPPEGMVETKKLEPIYWSSVQTDIPKPVEDLLVDGELFEVTESKANLFELNNYLYDIESSIDFVNYSFLDLEHTPKEQNSPFDFYDASSSFYAPFGGHNETMFAPRAAAAGILGGGGEICRPIDLSRQDHPTHLDARQRQQQQQHPSPDSVAAPPLQWSLDDSISLNAAGFHREDAGKQRRRGSGVSGSSVGTSDSDDVVRSSLQENIPVVKKHGNANKGNHLWEFIRQLLKASELIPNKDRIIQWECREEGVFRIIDSKEVASQWGRYKNNDNMTYEKLSRALRWCRTFGFLSALPKDGKFPKKLCFRFGPRARNWRHCV